MERKNITLQESDRVMLHAKHLPYHFWAEAMNTTCHIHNRVTLRSAPQQPYTRYGKEENLLSNTFMFLIVSALYW